MTDSNEAELGALLDRLFLQHRVTDTSFDFASLKQSLAKDWRIVSAVGADTDSVVSPRISKDFFELARRGAKDVAAATLGMNVNQPDGIAWRTKAAAAAADRGYVVALCPFTGVSRRVDHTLGPSWKLIEHHLGYCLASDIGATMVDTNLETVWIFPQEHLILATTIGLPAEHIFDAIASFFLNVLSNQDLVITYVTRDIPPRDHLSVADFWCPHIGHNLWNVQTAWFNLLNLTEVLKFDKIYYYDGQNFFGRLNELYPEKFIGQDKLYPVCSDSELFQTSLKSGEVLLTLKDEYFSPGFSDALLNLARKRVSPEFLAELKQLRDSSSPLIIATVRLNNRAWVEQLDGYSQLFSALRADFPRLGVILDGLSTDTAKGWTTDWMSMEDELVVAHGIREATPADMPLAFAVGRTLAEALLLCDAADCFIAPSGTGMGFYKWVSNLPGIAISNTAVLDVRRNRSWAPRVWHNPAFRGDITPTVHLSPELVQDVDPNAGGDRSNFHLDWRVLYSEALSFLSGIGFNAKSCS